MGTVIDSLSVELGLDNKGFKKGIKESEKIQDDFATKTETLDKKQVETQRKTERQKQGFHKEELHRNKEVLDSMFKMRNEVLGLLTIFTAGKGIFDFVRGTIETGVSFAHMSDNIDVSVHKLGGWSQAMKEAGGSAEDASSMLDKAAMSVVSGTNGVAPNASKIGLMQMAGKTGTDIHGAFKDAESFLLAQAKVLKAMFATEDHAKALSQAREIMHLTTTEIDLLKKGDTDVQRRVQAGAAVAGWTDRQARDAERAKRAWESINTTLDSIGRKLIAEPLEKWLTKNMEDIKTIATWLSQPVSKDFENLGNWLDKGPSKDYDDIKQWLGNKDHKEQFERMYQVAGANNFENGQSGNTTLTVVVPPGTDASKIKITQTGPTHGARVDIVHQGNGG